ncbi:hypothetical protein A2999_01985 [Candidatus Wolfebacteria bacterium RIFCSPLOWO2_01_FULL_38_11]|uniref:Uncharacterized protein n=2 Tax=Candidatus Wolfeibacteriota TaxID=1752735 RepID=A0A0G0G754_9BACT|nr:MAG: hypothetical protein US36_C0012G0029 [Candidatus Wolfebacteria bacterium GW2011_GWC1_37_10]OGM90502.1 MAG: hypothetical protein A2999_01985 [Candidatus Wolfebacteria bacterium RIFCSPLOWO2_01_FULL_38_11]
MLIIYLFNRFFFRIKEFFRHWYIKSFFFYTHAVISFFEKLDRFFALKITFRFLFQPLYADRSAIGYILGFIFRSIRIIIASFVYLAVFFIAIIVYVFWMLIPIIIFLEIINFDFSLKWIN